MYIEIDKSPKGTFSPVIITEDQHLQTFLHTLHKGTSPIETFIIKRA